MQQFKNINNMQVKKHPNRFEQVIEKVRIQVNVRDSSISSNEGQAPLTNNLKNESKESFTYNDKSKTVRHHERVKAGFNVSYDSNTFQGIKNNLIQ